MVDWIWLAGCSLPSSGLKDWLLDASVLCLYHRYFCKIVYSPICLVIISWGLSIKHHLQSGNRADVLFLPRLPDPSKYVHQHHHLSPPSQAPGNSEKLVSFLILTITPNLPPFLGYFCFLPFTTIPEAINTEPDLIREM